MTVFFFESYKNFLKEEVKNRKNFDATFGFHQLAEAAGIQRSYLSKVMSADAHLSADQLHLIADYLKLFEHESDFLQLLLECDKSNLPMRRKTLEAKIQLIASEHRDTAKHLNAKSTVGSHRGELNSAEYYLDPLNQLVHVAIAVDRFSREPLLLAAELGLTGAQIFAIISLLERLGFAKKQGTRVVALEPKLHLSKNSPLFRAWRNQLKMMAAQRVNQLPENKSYSFTSVFSADVKTQKKIHEKFIEFLKFCESTVSDAQSMQVYQISFDLFPWTN